MFIKISIIYILFPTLLSLQDVLPSLKMQAKKSYPIEQTLQSCIAKDFANDALLKCYQTAYTEWDKELNQYYKELKQLLNNKQQRILKNAQRNWINYRDSEFSMLSTIYGSLNGNQWQLLIMATKVEIVKQRALELHDYIQTLRFDTLSVD